MERVLAIGSHFDDVELGCAGSLLKHKGEIHIAILQAADHWCGKPDDRFKEQEESCKLLGSTLQLYSDKLLDSHKVIAHIESFNPDWVYFPYEQDYHQDHKHASKIGFAIARRPNIKAIRYITPTSYNCYPNVFREIDIESKLEVLKCFKSQVERRPDYLTMVKAQNAFFGSLIGKPYAEGFIFHRMILD